ncbi:hypothetical protein [uncultured Tateyamaria sp.]|uniref:hypothetical protein n=1 Tax=uncultured Tateyamaria sp. TaxID=455651 RepID=UPI002604322F|nr:hypothetical protein [uncultured Tateyamaria sp.]
MSLKTEVESATRSFRDETYKMQRDQMKAKQEQLEDMKKKKLSESKDSQIN